MGNARVVVELKEHVRPVIPHDDEVSRIVNPHRRVLRGSGGVDGDVAADQPTAKGALSHKDPLVAAAIAFPGDYEFAVTVHVDGRVLLSVSSAGVDHYVPGVDGGAVGQEATHEHIVSLRPGDHEIPAVVYGHICPIVGPTTNIDLKLCDLLIAAGVKDFGIHFVVRRAVRPHHHIVTVRGDIHRPLGPAQRAARHFVVSGRSVDHEFILGNKSGGLIFVRADIRCGITGQSPLIDGRCAGCRARVEGWAARQECMGPGRPPVVCQTAQHGVLAVQRISQSRRAIAIDIGPTRD